MKKRIYFQILIIIGSSLFSCQNKSLTDAEKIDEQLKRWKDIDNPGLVVSVSKNDSLVYSNGFGLANIDQNEKNTTNTIFNIGSISKSVTAACILKLVHDKKITLNDSLTSFFPELHPKISHATIKQLLNHTSGIRDNESFGQLVESKGVDEKTGFFTGDDNDQFDLLKIQKTLNFPHGSKYMYNNTGYWLLGQIVEKISGVPIEEFANKQLFQPLEMNHTSFGNPKNQAIAIGYHVFNTEEGPKPINITANSYGDGGVYSSTEDLVKWFHEILSGEKFGMAFWKEMKTKGLLNDKTEVEYGAGLEIKKKNGGIIYSHGGLVPGYFGMTIAYPETKTVISVLTNQTQIDAGEIVTSVEKAIFPEIKKPEIITLSESESKKYLGKFQQTTGSEIGLIRHITKKGNDYFYHRPGSEDTQIFPIGSDEFIMPFGNQRADIKIETGEIPNKRKLIFKGNDGEPDRVYTEITDNKNAPAPSIAVNNFIGTYRNDETLLTWQVKKVQEELYIDVNTFESPLLLTADSLFTFEGRFFIKFNTDKENKSTDFTLDFGKAKNIKFHNLEKNEPVQNNLSYERQ